MEKNLKIFLINKKLYLAEDENVSVGDTAKLTVNEHFPNIPVFFGPFSYDKYRHCASPEDILIDDRTSNCEEWISAGGKAHIYRNWPDCKVWLEEQVRPL